MKKKIAIIGRGTAGAISILNFYRFSDYEIDWYFDPDIKTQAVGEGTDLIFPHFLSNTLTFNYSSLKLLDGNFKYGIYKEGWGKTGEEFFHNFPLPSVGLHINAIKFQDYVSSLFVDKKRVNIKNQNISHDEIDAEYIIDCAGRPDLNSNEFKENFILSQYIPVNSVYVTQCYWDKPEFQYSLTIAKKHGWVFGIPLSNRCSIGYLYNSEISSLEEVKEDVKEIFDRYSLKPSNVTNSFKFGNYYRKNNFEKNIAYNGNSSFFLEPIEATSITTIIRMAQSAFDVFANNLTQQTANENYARFIQETEAMIMLHYFAGSRYESKFWNYAEERGIACIENTLRTETKFANIISNVLNRINLDRNCNQNIHKSILTNTPAKINQNSFASREGFSTWGAYSFYENIKGLNIVNKLSDLGYKYF